MRKPSVAKCPTPVLFALALASYGALAEDMARAYTIPAGHLAEALTDFADQADLKLVINTELTRGLKAPALRGTVTVEQGLDRLLQGSGLGYRMVGHDTAIIEPKPAAAGAGPKSAATLPAMHVTADNDYPVGDPRFKEYAVPTAGSANRTDTPVMETPMSIEVVPRAVLQDQQSIQVGDAIKNVSGTFQGFAQGGFAEQFMIRGFNTGFATGVFMDGFRWPASRLTLANADRVEVLKGAAANLYGRIQPGGLINIVSKRPQAAAYYALEQQVGSYDQYRTTLDATGGLNDDKSLMYRFNLEYLDENSFRDFAFTDRVVVAPSLTWKLTDRTQFDLDFFYSNEDTQQDYGVVASRITRRPIDLPISRYLMEPSTDQSNSTLYNTALTLTHRFNDDWKLKARFNHFHRDISDVQTYGVELDDNQSSPTYGNLIRDYYGAKSLSHTLYGNVNVTGRFSTWDVDHEVLAGWENYSTVSDSLDSQWHPIDYVGTTINIFNPIYRPTNASALPHHFQDGTGGHSNGVYFQDQITFFDRLHVMGGGRYDWITDVNGSSDISPADAKANQSKSKNEQFSPRVGILYQPWHWLSAYGNYVESLGSANGAVDQSGQLLDPETAQQFEIGFKTSLFDDRLTGTLAYYHLTKQNIAVPVPGTSYSELIGSARSQGIEVDVSGQIAEGLNLIASYAYTDAIVKQGVTDAENGRRLWNIPRNAASLWATYDFPYPEVRGLTVGAGAFMQDQKEGDRDNNFQLPGWVRVDAMLRYRLPLPKSKLSLQFNVENLLDHQYYAASGNGLLGINPGQPRTYMGSIKMEF